MLFYCLLIDLSLHVLGQNYYMNFVFNNYRYPASNPPAAEVASNFSTMANSTTDSREVSHEDDNNHDSNAIYIAAVEEETEEEVENGKHEHAHSDSYEVNHNEDSVDESDLAYTIWKWPTRSETDFTYEDRKVESEDKQKDDKVNADKGDKKDATTAVTPTEITTDKHKKNVTTTEATTNKDRDTANEPTEVSIKESQETTQTTTQKSTKPKTTEWLPTTEADEDWSAITPHPPSFFVYPNAQCREEMDLHELFGIDLLRDRGLPAKVLCQFDNGWGGPWLLMNRMELPARLHLRHWFFGYVTEDYKDMNINFLGLAHLMNQMRMAMLILGQDNNNQTVYNLYDDVVISGFNDLFMLRKAHLIEANTTDLLFISVGDVMESYSGRNRTCPFRLLGAWWGHNLWGGEYDSFCVFPVERNPQLPGYMAIFIKPNPFAINNTALYDYAMTTRRPWVPTVDEKLLQQVGYNRDKYDEHIGREFVKNKQAVKKEQKRRKDIHKDIEAKRKAQVTEQTEQNIF